MVLRRKITIKFIGGIQSRESQTNYNYQRERERGRDSCLSVKIRDGVSAFERGPEFWPGEMGAGQDNWDKCTKQVSGRDEGTAQSVWWLNHCSEPCMCVW